MIQHIAADGSLRAPEPAPEEPRPPQKFTPLNFSRSRATVSFAATKSEVRPLLLQSTSGGPQPFVALSYNGLGLSVSPKFDAVAYVTAEGVFIRALVKVSLEDLKKIKATQEERVLSERAKMLALGLIMYAADYDDVFPAHAEGVGTVVNPYMRDELDPTGVHFLLAGVDQTKIENPATTVMGYIQGTQGTAFLYADGHVHWVPK